MKMKISQSISCSLAFFSQLRFAAQDAACAR